MRGSHVVFAFVGLVLSLAAAAHAFDPLDTDNCYDFVILAHDCLAAASQPLVCSSSLRTCLVTTSEVLAAFGEDSLTVDDVREFVEYAYFNWTIVPTHLLLVGDVARHPWGQAPPVPPPDYQGYVPSYPRVDYDYVDDGWIVRGITTGSKPLMHLGRIPARVASELTRYCDKLLSYRNSQPPEPWFGHLLFLVGDWYDHNAVMRTYADSLIAHRLSNWGDLTTLYASDYEVGYPEYPAQAVQDVRGAWNSGCGLINAFGNTPLGCWLVYMVPDFCCESSPTFTASLGATCRFPVVFGGSCFVNNFSEGTPHSQYCHQYCVADDVLLTADDRGAVACFASSDDSPAFEGYLMNDIFLELLATKGIRDLGRLCTATEVGFLRQGIGEEYVAWQYCLLGDPTIQIKVPQCWNCLEEDYMKKWISGIEIEDPRIQQERYTDDPITVSHPNLRIVHDSGGVVPPCGERMIRATARDDNGSGQVVWDLAETYFDVNPNSMLIFRMCVPQSPGDGANVCIDAQRYGDEVWLSSHAGTFDQFGNGLDPASRPPLSPGWHTFYVDLSAFVDSLWYQEISSIVLRYENQTSTPGSLEVYVDDIQFRKTNAWRGEILNPDFEEDADGDGKPDFWTDLDGEASSVVSLWDDFAYSGMYSLRVSNQGEEDQGAKQIVHLNHEYEQYHLRFSAKANLDSQVRWRVIRIDNEEILCSGYGNIDREWRTRGCAFNNPWYPGNGVSLISVEILPEQGGIAYIDSVALVGGLFGGVERGAGVGPTRTALDVVPNPANPTCEIRFHLAHGGDVSLAIFDVNGRLVSEVVAGRFARGTHHRAWDGRDTNGSAVASGIYFCRLTEGRRVITKKVVVVR